jgi:hypothetical protein
MAAATPSARAGTPPPLTPEQQQVLGETAARAAAAPIPKTQTQPAKQIASHAIPESQTSAGPAPVPLENSAIVGMNAQGVLAVAMKNGKPLEGVKLSRHDSYIISPGIAVSREGAIHIAFVERHSQSPYEDNVYHRSSADGGKNWSEAKNLSEVMPGFIVGNCQVAVDVAGNAYVIWRTSVKENYPVDRDAHARPNNHLVYRVLSNGKWSGKAVAIHPNYPENDGVASWFACTDPAGKVHVIWNMRPDSLHPEAMTKYGKSPCIGAGMIMEAVLNDTDPGTPREIYHTKITEDTTYHSPGCDDLDTIDGYVDAARQVHLIAHVSYAGVGPTDPNHRIHLIEGGVQTLAVNLPNKSFNIWRYPPRLLLDATGRRHIIAMYEAGEQPSIRDYLIGSADEPSIIRAAKEVKGKLIGFQASQGSHGRMVALMEMNDTGNNTDDELYISTSDGGSWTPPVNVTNNTGRKNFFSRDTSIAGASHVASASYWFPGPAAAAYAQDGHLALLYISNQLSVVQSVSLGWTLAGGSSRKPNLLFLRF